MIIKASAAIRQNYNAISELCRKSKEPVFLTKNGEGDLVVMDMETYSHREKMLKLREELVAAEEECLHSGQLYSVDEVDAQLEAVIGEVEHESQKAI